jgi:DNA-binding SARP family transcriptional activator
MRHIDWGVEFRILGPLEVAAAGDAVSLGGPRERTLLALLLVHANRVVAIDQLVDELWEGSSADSARALRVCVSRLRKSLRQVGADQALVTQAPGYVLRAPAEAIDAHRFEALVAAGREALAGGRAAEAADALAGALALWRGPALAEVADLPFARPEALRLEQARVDALEARIEADLACGRHVALVGELEALVGRYPLREGLWGHRMLALYRSGRQADALRACHELRHMLAEELGIEPSPAIRDLESRILRHDDLDWPVAAAPPPAPPPPSEPGTGIVTILVCGPDGEAEVFGSAAEAIEAAVARQPAGPIGLDAGERGAGFDHVVARARELAGAGAGAEGQILASRLVAALAGPHFDFTDAGDACRLEWGRPGLPLPGLLAGADPGDAFVGRGEEMKRLVALWPAVEAGRRQLALVSGEPGIGKTRLATEWGLAASREGAVVLSGRCDEEAVAPYQPFVEALDHYVRHCPVERLRSQVGWGGGQLCRLLPELAARLPELAVPPPATDPESERYRLFEAVADLLAAASADAPLVLLLDDLHWADRPTLLMLRHVASHRAAASLLIVGTYRDADVGPGHPLHDTMVDLRRHQRFLQLSLAGLDEADVAALLAELGLAGLAQPLHRASEGNPLFIREMVRHLAGTDTDASQLTIPDGVREVIEQRLQRLSDDANRVLTLGAVVGRTFSLPLVRQLAEVGTDAVLEALEEGLAGRVIAEVPGSGEAYTFTHHLIRQTLYERLGAVRRARLHRRVADALGEGEGELGELAHHLAAAALTGGDAATAAAAVDHCRRAGQRALAGLAYEEAVAHFRRALDVAALDPATTDDDRYELLMGLGDARWRSGDVRSARATYHDALAVARRLGDGERLARTVLAYAIEPVGFGAVNIANDGQAALLEEALAAVSEADSPLRVRLLALLAGVLTYSGSPRRAQLGAEALAMADRLGDPRLRLTALEYHVVGAGPTMPAAEQLAVGDEMVRLATETDDRAGLLNALFVRRTRLLLLGDLARADAANRETAALAERLRAPFYIVRALLHDASRATLQGRFDEASALTTRAMALADSIGADWSLVAYAAQTAMLHWLQGRLDELEPALTAFASSFAQIPAFGCGLAFVHAIQGRRAEARAALDRYAADGFALVPRSDEWWLSLWLLAHVAALLGDRPRAAALYDLLLPDADLTVVDGGAWVCAGSVQVPLGILAACDGRLDDAAAHLAVGTERNRALGALPFVAQAQHAHAAVLAARAGPGDLPEARRLNAEALATFERLGMPGLAARARALFPATPA